MELQQVIGVKEDVSGTRKIGLCTSKYLISYGFHKEDKADEGSDYRCTVMHKPTEEEVKDLITNFINEKTDSNILNGFTWNNLSVYLSKENQMNFKAAYDLAIQTNGATLPIKFKLGETPEGDPTYFTFEDLDTFTNFYTQAVAHVTKCLTEGWEEKDSINWSKYIL